jgi:hypothetical protein
MPSANDFVTGALRLLGVVNAIDTPEPEDLVQGGIVLNEMIDEWATQRRTIYTTTRHVHNLVANQASYTIGVGGEFNQPRPLWIPHWALMPTPAVTPQQEIPYGRALDLEEYRRIPIKSTTSAYPNRIYYDAGWTAGLGTVKVYPVPDSSTPDIVLYTPTALTEFADATTDYTFPPGYRKAIRTKLTLELYPYYPSAELPPGLEKLATDAFANIKRANERHADAMIDAAFMSGGGGNWDIYSGE